MITFPKPTVEQFFRTFFISDFTVSDDETQLIFSSNLNGKMNVWKMDLPHTFPYLFAHVDQTCNFIEMDKENRFVLAGFDQDGDENYQIYALPPGGGIPQKLITGDPKEKYYFSYLSKDGERLYYQTSEGNPNYLNTRMRDLKKEEDVLIHQGENAPTYLAAVSKEENVLVYLQLMANTYINLFIEKDEKKTYLVPDYEKVHVSANPIIINEETIYFTTNYESAFSYLAKFDLKENKFTEVLQLENEDISNLTYDEENKILYLTTEVGVTDKLYSFTLEGKTLTLLETPVDIIEKMQVMKSGTIYLLGRSATVPDNLYRLEAGKKWERLTNNHVLGVRRQDMVEPDVITYTSFDGMEIEALLFKAKAENDNGHTIFWPHGGPQAAERKFFRAMFQAFLNRGYSIFAPNFRGSTGYGASFVKLVEQDWGHGPRLDCVAGIEWLFENNITEKEKLFLVGGSYGGYMALLLHGRHPDYFKAVVDIFGVSNLFTFVESVPEHWKPMMERWIGDPVRDKERFIKDTPITYLDTMTKPMLVIQGAKDPRVVKEESDQIVAQLKEKGRDVTYVVLEDEGHGFTKKENEINVYQQMLDFLEKHQS